MASGPKIKHLGELARGLHTLWQAGMVPDGEPNMPSTLDLRLAADRAEVEAYQARGTENEAAARQAYHAARDAYRVEMVALEHAQDIEDQLEPHERRACLAGDAVFGGLMDEWQSLAAAFARVVGRPVWTLVDVDEGRCTPAELNADHDVLYNAMDSAHDMLNTH